MTKIIELKPTGGIDYEALYWKACKERDALRRQVLELRNKLGEKEPSILVTTATIERV